jgi:general secretion pathway protein L
MFSIGIDIGSFSIKVAKVRGSARGYDLMHFSEYPLSQDPTKDHKIEIHEALQDIKKRLHEENTQIVIGAHLFDVAWRRKEFPFRERHKILKSLPFELEDDIPFSSENAVFDAKVTHFTGDTAHVLAFACPVTHLTEILKNYQDANVAPSIVSVDSIAFANVIEAWRESPWEYATGQDLSALSEADIAINIGHKTTTLVVIKDGYTLDTRLIDWGGKDIADAIAQRYNMHPIEALKELRKRAFILMNNEGATKEQVALSEVVKSSVDQLSQRLNLALLELRTHYNLKYRQAILTGGVSQLRNLGPYLTQKLDIATNRLAQLEMIPQIDFAASPNNELAGITAIGLAIEGVRRPKNPALNLLRGDFAPQSQTFRLIWEKWSHAAKVAGALFLVLLIWGSLRDMMASSNVDTANDVLKRQSNSILNQKGAKFSERNIRAYIKEQEQKVKLKEMVESLQTINSALDALKKISALAPAKSVGGLNVFDFSVDGDIVSISGEASRVEVLTDLQKALKAAAKDSEVRSAAPTRAVHSGYKAFRYSIQIERKSGGSQ